MATSHPVTEPTTEQDLLRLVRVRASEIGDRTFITFADRQSMTFAQFAERVSGVRTLLKDLDVQVGDRVALMMKNSLFYPVAWLGIVSFGATAVPMNSRLGEIDARYIIEHSEAKLCISDNSTESVARAAGDKALAHFVAREGDPMDELAMADEKGAHDLTADAIANVQYTSGTTGFPKGCLLTHRYWQQMGISSRILMGIDGDDTMLTAQPHSYIDPQWNVIAALQAGAHLVLLDGFHPSSLMRSIAEFDVSIFYCLGVMPTLMLKQPEAPWDDSHCLRRVYCSGIPPQLHRAIEERWGVPWFEAFGMTETGINTGMLVAEHDASVGTGCIGRPLEHCDVSVVDELGRNVAPGTTGEMRLRGSGFMNGYLKDPDATTEFFEEGWAHTGDLVEMDEQGLIFYRGRRKEMIRRGGENISPVEVEAHLSVHPAVLECAVAPVPDEDMGEEIKAYVVPKPDAAVEAHELHDYLARRLAPFKVPRYFEFRSSLPHTASEKVAKQRLGEEMGPTVDVKSEAHGRSGSRKPGR